MRARGVPGAAAVGRALVVAGLLAAGAQDARAAGRPADDRSCASALRSVQGFATFGTPSEDASITVSRPVWRRRGRTLTGVAVHREGGRALLRVCSGPTAQLGPSGDDGDEPSTAGLRAVGAPVVVGRGRIATSAAVADPWLAWSTRRPGTDGFRIARRAIRGGPVAGRAFRGRLLAVAVTRDGTAVVSTLTGRVQRVYRWRPNGRTDALAAPRTVRLDAQAPVATEPTGVRLWGPDTVWLVPPKRDDHPRPLGPRELIDTRRTRPCRAWSTAPAGSTATTRRLRAVLGTTDAWSRAIGTGDEPQAAAGSATTLEVCDRATGARQLAFDAGYDTHDDDASALDQIRLVGDAVLGFGSSAQGSTGSGSSGAPIEVGFVRPAAPGAPWRTITGRNLATREAAAWTADGSVWVSDRAGTRAVAPIPDGFLGLRLTPGALTIVSGTGSPAGASATVTREQRIAVVPLPAGDVGTPRSGGTASNFGICVAQFSSYCPDPATPGRPATP